jgi:elongation factor Ts
MTDCKNALVEADGDFDKAVEQLRIKGLKGVAKREGRAASNGLVIAKLEGTTKGTLLELNCETDFVAKTPDFVALAQTLVEHGEQSKLQDAAALGASTLADGRAVADVIQEFSAKIGEKIVLNRFAVLDGTVAVYLHRKAQDLPPQVGVLVEYTGKSDEAGDADARGIGMQIAAMRPRFLNRSDVPAETVESERRIAEQTAREEGKPEQALPKIVEGRVNSFFKDFVLLEQPSVTDNKKTVAQVAKEAGVEVTRFVRYEVGQE